MDKALFQFIQSYSGRNRVMDSLMIFASTKVRYIFAFVFLLMWLFNSERKVPIKVLQSTVLAFLINSLIKLFTFKPRPFLKGRVDILIPSKKDSTFPSKHTILMFAFSTSVMLRNRVLGVILTTLSCLTGFSRIWVGSHYPSDIVGSATLGSLISLVVNKVKGR
ncbi:undecaprenyl-diphosphatase [Bacillus sp. HMF5848]|uniref:undecaprenyl-diphosphatase n=1 Tax=Bacillus sp. HMF5848 TaxID=2495421 RepID=UPI000F77C56A|nr:undecaprenyl-diphosphatase [Bacillus sp. HMF5848]RSK29142.1 undecaprenyl-diphosphatase [Bacillus sp. HMF5848]